MTAEAIQRRVDNHIATSEPVSLNALASPMFSMKWQFSATPGFPKWLAWLLTPAQLPPLGPARLRLSG